MESRRLAISSLLSSRPSTPVAPAAADEVESPLDSLAIAASLVSRGPPSAKRQTPSPPSPPAKKPRSDDAHHDHHHHHHTYYHQHHTYPEPHYPPPMPLPTPVHHPVPATHQHPHPPPPPPQRFYAEPPRPIVPVMVTPTPRPAIPRLGPTEMLNQIKAETEAARPHPQPHRLSPVELRHQIIHETPIPVVTSQNSPGPKQEHPPLSPVPLPYQHARTPTPPPVQFKPEPEPVHIHDPAPFRQPTPPPPQPLPPQPVLQQPPPTIKSEPVAAPEPSIDDELMAEIDLAESHAATTTTPAPALPPPKQPTPPVRPPPKPTKTQSKSKSSRNSSTFGKNTTNNKKSKQRKSNPVPPAPRSRSVSHHPQFDDDEKDHDWEDEGAVPAKKKTKTKEKEVVEEDEEDNKEDDKLYCLCRTPYDDDIVMIACDRCDEWYHPECVELPEKMIDLVDQFVCPVCRDRNPQWCTTYKARCLQGVASVRPNSPSSCHNPARPPFSKYCSEECGIKNMERKIDAWEFGGGRAEEGRIDRLWEAVRGAKKREAVIVTASDPLQNELSPVTSVPATATTPPSETQLSLLNRRLSILVADSALRTREMKHVDARQRLLQLSIARADNPEHLATCGFDYRLLMSGEEWIAWTESPEGVAVLQRGIVGTGVPLDGPDGVGWCRGRRKCERHAGWQKLCAAEVELEKGVKDLALKKLAIKERDIRMRIDAIQPQQVNGHASDAMVT